MCRMCIENRGKHKLETGSSLDVVYSWVMYSTEGRRQPFRGGAPIPCSVYIVLVSQSRDNPISQSVGEISNKIL